MCFKSNIFEQTYLVLLGRYKLENCQIFNILNSITHEWPHSSAFYTRERLNTLAQLCVSGQFVNFANIRVLPTNCLKNGKYC